MAQAYPAALILDEKHSFEGGQVPSLTKEPTRMPQMAIDFRNPKNLPRSDNGERGFSIGLYECRDGGQGLCLEAWCCPCITYGSSQAKMSGLQHGTQQDESCNAPCWTFCLLNTLTGGIGGCLLSCLQRGNIRERYAISGGCCGDCGASWCCTPCALIQGNREIELECQAVNTNARQH